MEGIKVSIVVCSYNQEKYIRQTLKSIIEQDHIYSYEIIVCDDASTDTTPHIIEEFAHEYPEIKPILRKKNIGVVKNFFDGLNCCQGEYIMACAGDDFYLPGKVKYQIEYLERHPSISLIYSDIQTITELGKPLRIISGPKYSSVKEMISRYSIAAPTMAIRRKDLLKYIKDVNPIKRSWKMEDLPISLWFMINCKIEYVPFISVGYRLIENSISHPVSYEKRFEFEESVFQIFLFFQNKYPEYISYNFIIKQYLFRICKYQYLLDKYKSYYLNLVNELKISGDKSGIALKLRIQSKHINFLFRVASKIKEYFK